MDTLHFTYTFDDPGDALDEVVARMDTLAVTERQRLTAHLARHNVARRRISKVDLEQARADLDSAHALDDDELVVQAANLLLYGYMAAGQPDAALAVYARHEPLLEASPDLDARAERLGNLSAVLANQDRHAEADVQVMKAIACVRQQQNWAELMVLMSNRQLILRNQGRLAALEWLEDIDRLHASEHANQRSWLLSRMAASENLRDAGRYRDALRVLNQERERTRVVAGDRALAWETSEVGLWLQLGQHARALQVLRDLDPDRTKSGPAWLQARLHLVHAQARARALGQGTCDRPDTEAWERLNLAAEVAPRDSRRATRFEVELQRAAWIEPDAGAALAEGLADQASVLGMWGYARRGWLLACARALDAGRAASAQRAGERAAALAMHSFGPGATAEPVMSTGASPLLADLVCLRLAEATGLRGAAERSEQALARLQELARTQVPDEYRDSFLHRVPVHIELSTLANRLSAA